MEALEQIKGVLRPQVGRHVVAVASIAVQLRHVPHLELGAVGPGGVGCIDQPQRQFHIAVVVVADLCNHKAGFAGTNAPLPELQAIRGGPCHGNDPALFVQKWQRNDARGQQSCQFSGWCSLRSAAAIGVHRRRHRAVQIDVVAFGDPASEIAIGQHPLEDARLRYDKN